MKKQIIIETDDAGINLYNMAIRGLNFYARHLDQLNNWNKTLDELAILKTSYNINYGVELEDLKILISINSLLSRAIADLHLIGSELYISKFKLQQIFYMKHAYLVVYETFENIRKQQSFLSKIANKAGDIFF